MSRNIIKLTEDFHSDPFGRDAKDGDDNAQAFRKKHLIPALREYHRVVVDLSDYYYYGSPFLEETFGGMVREGFDLETLKKKLKVVHTELPSIVAESYHHIKRATGSRGV